MWWIWNHGVLSEATHYFSRAERKLSIQSLQSVKISFRDKGEIKSNVHALVRALIGRFSLSRDPKIQDTSILWDHLQHVSLKEKDMGIFLWSTPGYIFLLFKICGPQTRNVSLPRILLEILVRNLRPYPHLLSPNVIINKISRSFICTHHLEALLGISLSSLPPFNFGQTGYLVLPKWTM